jgi:hypothetical protein
MLLYRQYLLLGNTLCEDHSKQEQPRDKWWDLGFETIATNVSTVIETYWNVGFLRSQVEQFEETNAKVRSIEIINLPTLKHYFGIEPNNYLDCDDWSFSETAERWGYTPEFLRCKLMMGHIGSSAFRQDSNKPIKLSRDIRAIIADTPNEKITFNYTRDIEPYEQAWSVAKAYAARTCALRDAAAPPQEARKGGPADTMAALPPAGGEGQPEIPLATIETPPSPAPSPTSASPASPQDLRYWAKVYRDHKTETSDPDEKSYWEMMALRLEGLTGYDIYQKVFPHRKKSREAAKTYVTRKIESKGLALLEKAGLPEIPQLMPGKMKENDKKRKLGPPDINCDPL